MAVSITATPEPDQARIAIKAEGGTIGEAFFIGRRGRDGILSLVRETSESSRIWERDPAGQRINLFKTPRFEIGATAAILFENIFQNPNLIVNNDVTQIVRSNLAANPGFEELVRYEVDFGGGAGTSALNNTLPFSGSSHIRATWTAAGRYGGIFANTFDVTPGRDYTVSTYVRTKTLKKMRLVMRWNGTGVQLLGPETSVRAYASNNTGWTRLVWQGKAPAGAVSGIPSAYLSEGAGQAWAVGDWMDIDGMLIEVGTTLGTYFDGSSGGVEVPNEGRYATAWTGEANRTISILYSERFYSLTGSMADIRPYGDGVGIVPNGTGNSSNVLIDHANQMVAGGTYTITLEASVLRRDGISVNQYAGALTVVSKNGTATLSTQQTEPVGVGSNQEVSGTFTIPAGATSVEVRFWNGSPKSYGITTIKKIQIVKGAIDPGFFTGDTANANEIIYGWADATVYSNGTIGTSTASAQRVASEGGANLVVIHSSQWRWNGTKSMRLHPTTASNNSYAKSSAVDLEAGKTYTFLGVQQQNVKLTGSLHTDSRRVRVTGAGMDKLVSTQPENIGARRTQFRWTFTIPAGATAIQLEFVHGGTYGSGDLFWDQVLITEGAYTGNYFDGETESGIGGGWNGTKDSSTSYRYSNSLAITVYDYEARQGQSMEYYVLTAQGQPAGDGTKIDVPEWGTWLKDPFRPYLNTKLYFNSDEKYTRRSNQVLMQPRGSRLPVVQWERRTAPSGTIRFLTETADDARRFTTLIDETGVVFLDVAEDFGVPFRYAALGDIGGERAVSSALRDPHRYWDVEMQEVAMPIGEPSAMSATYENLMATFASYLELRGSVADYKAVAAGEWL